MPYVWLGLAIAVEVGATLSLRAAVDGRRIWYVVTTIGYVASFACLSIALALGLGLGIAYGIWVAVGVAATAVLSKLIFGEAFTPFMAVGVGLIASGVLVIELGAH